MRERERERERERGGERSLCLQTGTKPHKSHRPPSPPGLKKKIQYIFGLN